MSKRNNSQLYSNIKAKFMQILKLKEENLTFIQVF